MIRMETRIFAGELIHQVNRRSDIHDCDTRDRRRRGYASSSASWHALLPQCRRCGVTRARDLAAVRFTVILNLDASYYASRLVPRRNLDDVVSPDALRRDDGVTPFPGSDCETQRLRKSRTPECRTVQRMSEQCDM